MTSRAANDQRPHCRHKEHHRATVYSTSASLNSRQYRPTPAQLLKQTTCTVFTATCLMMSSISPNRVFFDLNSACYDLLGDLLYNVLYNKLNCTANLRLVKAMCI